MHDQNAQAANPRNVRSGLAADAELVHRIDELVEEEHRLEREHSSETGLSPEQRARLDELEVQLDQAWDLLRQRRARRSAGLDPSEARPRDSTVVEHYQQ